LDDGRLRRVISVEVQVHPAFGHVEHFMPDLAFTEHDVLWHENVHCIEQDQAHQQMWTKGTRKLKETRPSRLTFHGHDQRRQRIFGDIGRKPETLPWYKHSGELSTHLFL
jgi:hypothetical protein